MNILKFRNAQLLDEAAASIITGLVQTNPRAVLGLATGSTPIGMYREMVKAHEQQLVSFRNVTTFNLDEYVGLAANHPQSYHYFMQEHLFSHLDIPSEQIHIPDGTAANTADECVRYEALLEQTRIDLQVLGLGNNGHIGFNEPAVNLNAATHVVRLDEDTRKANSRFFETIDEVPTHAITMGVGSILKARMVLLLVKGAAKADIVHRALTGPITTECPASLLQTHPHLVVLVDDEAGRLLA